MPGSDAPNIKSGGPRGRGISDGASPTNIANGNYGLRSRVDGRGHRVEDLGPGVRIIGCRTYVPGTRTRDSGPGAPVMHPQQCPTLLTHGADRMRGDGATSLRVYAIRVLPRLLLLLLSGGTNAYADIIASPNTATNNSAGIFSIVFICLPLSFDLS